MSLQIAHFADIKILSIVWTIGSWLFVLTALLGVLLWIEQLISWLLSYVGIWFTTRKIGITFWLFCLIFWVGIFNAFSTKVNNVNIPVDWLENTIDIMYLADLHVDDIISTRHLITLKKEIEKLEPDLVLFWGDFFNRANVRQANYFEILWKISDPKHPWNLLPMFAVGGNHDMMWDLQALDRIEALTNIVFLDRENVQVVVLPSLNLQIVGLPDKSQWKAKSVQELLSGYSIISRKTSDFFTILLNHQPISLEKLKDFPIDLELAGHTHRGQIYGARALAAWVNDYGYGYFEEDWKKAIVTQGIGTWWLPLRLGSRSEIMVIHLIPKK